MIRYYYRVMFRTYKEFWNESILGKAFTAVYFGQLIIWTAVTLYGLMSFIFGYEFSWTNYFACAFAWFAIVMLMNLTPIGRKAMSRYCDICWKTAMGDM